MIRSALLWTLVFVCSSSHAKLSIQGQEMKIMLNGKRMGTLRMEIHSTDTSILFKNQSTGTATLPNGVKVNFKATAEHQLDNNWKWQKSNLVAARFPKDKINVTVGRDQLTLATDFRGLKNVRGLPYKGRAMSRRTFYNYLRTIKPPPPMTPQQIYLFNEATISVHKTAWTYLGKEKSGKEQLDKYELRGGDINSIVYINSKSELVKIKELDQAIEIIK